MPTVLLCLSGVLQSYGITSRWEERATGPRPTKSAVTGLVANALGRDLDAGLADLAALTFAVRADRPGQLTSDYQTAGGGAFPLDPLTAATDPRLAETPEAWLYGAARKPAPDADGQLRAPWKAKERTTVLSPKHYLQDAAFLVGLTTPSALLAQDITNALDRPARVLYLGRRCCPPDHPVAHGIVDEDAESWPEQVPLLRRATTTTPRVWIETPPGPGTTARPEQPPTTFAVRDHPVLYTRTLMTSPPPYLDEESR
ncbi:CRISPR-associated protein Cas5 (plasmid) [Streptomyces sp. NBC_00015]|uniref:CRISPR-associated protein Cas5 n=1 Tax=Streptomyces sp. NBC_00015 TaxID=2903611 RepID=UPI002F90FB87